MTQRASRFGGAAATSLALVTAFAGLAYVMLPVEQRLGVAGRFLLPSFAANPLPLQIEMLLLALIGVIGLAVVQPIRELVDGEHPWLRWASVLAIVGYAIGAVGNTLVMAKLPGIAASYVAATDGAKLVIAVFWRTTLDPFGLWQFGAVGIWCLVVGVVALRSRTIPRTGALLALAAGLAHLAIPVLLAASLASAIVALAGLAAVAMVGWFGWVGRYIWQKGEPVVEAAAVADASESTESGSVEASEPAETAESTEESKSSES